MRGFVYFMKFEIGQTVQREEYDRLTMPTTIKNEKELEYHQALSDKGLKYIIVK